MLFVFLLMQAATPPSSVPLLAEGNAHFTAGRYAEAHAAYHALLASGQASSALYYNLGLTYARLDSLGRAVQYFEKARRLDPEDARIGHNLAFVRTRLGLPSVTPPVPYWQQARARVQRAVPPLLAWWGGFALVCLAAGLWSWRLWSRPRDAWVRRGALLAATVGLASLGLGYALSAHLGEPHRAVALEPVVVRDAAGTSVPLKAGEVVVVRQAGEDARDRWRVALPSGAEGWVPAALLGEI